MFFSGYDIEYNRTNILRILTPIDYLLHYQNVSTVLYFVFHFDMKIFCMPDLYRSKPKEYKYHHTGYEDGNTNAIIHLCIRLRINGVSYV